MNKQEWKDHYESVGEAEGYKSINFEYSKEDQQKLDAEKIELRSGMDLGKNAAIKENFIKSKAARKRRVVRNLILDAKVNMMIRKNIEAVKCG